jgi:hypothetical protein
MAADGSSDFVELDSVTAEFDLRVAATKDLQFFTGQPANLEKQQTKKKKK